MALTKHFTLEEFSHSSKAIARGLTIQLVGSQYHIGL